MVMTKKNFKELATMCGNWKKANQSTDYIIEEITNFCNGQNALFDRNRFLDWVERVANGESTIGLG